MIRLGSLAGYPFEGPRVLGGWNPPTTAGVYAIMFRPDPDLKPQDFAVIYIDHSDDLSKEPFPFKHPRAGCWINRVGDRWSLHICTYEVPGGLRSHREYITRELISVYQPGCNLDQFDTTWKDEWIGPYSAPPAKPLTTSRNP